jgi:hypothetical protein
VTARRGMVAMAGAVALQLLSCGGDDPVDPCPTGSCDLPGSTIVKWRFDEYPEWKFQGDTCIDMDVFTVRVEVANAADPTITDSHDAQCGEGQATFLGLPEGTYNVAVTPLDFDGNPVVRAPGTGQVMAGVTGMNTETVVNVPYTAWLGTFTGTFLFRLSWGGKSCDALAPPVATQTLTLTAGGAVVAKLSDGGQRMDGTDPRPCRPFTEQFAQYVEMLPFGPATLLVVGKTGAETRFQHQFDTFVGAGKNNPTITFDLAPMDAGVDAPPDAPPDAM